MHQNQRENLRRTRKRAMFFSALGLVLSACSGENITDQTQAPDPVVVDVPIAYIERDLSVSGGDPIRSLGDPTEFIPGASLFIKQRANASAIPVDISQRLFPEALDEDGQVLPFDIKDLKADYSGNRLIFSVRAPELPSMQTAPTWNLWEYDRRSDTLRRIIESDTVAEVGHDTGPVYLADGRIIFSSTRQRGNQARLLDEGKPQYAGLEESLNIHASVLHIMDADGDNIQQISFNQSHDLDPLVLPNGKVLFSRWDQNNGNKGMNLYQINPDGSDLEIVYGRHSHDIIEGAGDVQYVKASVNPDGQVLLGLQSFSNPRMGTDFVTIDINNFVDYQQPFASMPAISSVAQQSALIDGIDLSGGISAAGFINALYPLWDGSGRVIYSWSQCRLYAPSGEETNSVDDGSMNADTQSNRTIAACTAENIADEAYQAAPPVYGLWMFDPEQNTQLSLGLPVLDRVVSELVAMEDRPFPANPSSNIDRSNHALLDAGMGVLHISSVYDVDGADTSPFGLSVTADPSQTMASQRLARFLRVEKSVSIPDDDTLDFASSAFGRSRNQLMREILGYTPIQPDGSVQVAIPAQVPFTISVVDAQGKRLSQRHNNWLQLMPGEEKSCIGCHRRDSQAPHGRIDAQTVSINQGAALTGQGFPGANPALFADLGETMAQTLARLNGTETLQPDIEFEDIWVDSAQQPPEPSFSLAYADLNTPLPISQSCAQNWSAVCRAVINFPDHIAPLFSLSRQILDSESNVIEDYTCIACHSVNDADGAPRVPDAQLDLSATASIENSDFLSSYRELLFNDNEQELLNGVLLDRLVPVLDGNGAQVFERDDEGELVLDAAGEPIPLTRTVRVNPSLNVNGALNSGRFFAVFETGSHQSWLSDAELRLIAEWIDLGGQYYNNPFDTPED
ncbi:HzsA-related protein [Agaribacter flavus]|uniref:Hydrazine synthase alpha subunit middle domain-containing protein n=1 Tax=Agaribacter flavus TaxID=1902781 RepID=A0ABV7FPU3_9ALTE